MPVLNAPGLWRHDLPVPGAGDHKYTRGHLVILGGARMTGAARLASEAAMRMGAGLCTIAAPESAAEVYKKAAPHVLFEDLKTPDDFRPHLTDPRRTAAILGPGAGLDDVPALKALISGALSTRKPVLLDADALTAFAGDEDALFRMLGPGCILTPHEGEFSKLFGSPGDGHAEAASRAARRSGAVVLLKGAETVIAGPDGRVVVNAHASPYLATAGSGDVLAGMIGGLLAQGMDAFHAACAAAWIHGDAAIRQGPGLVAPDIIARIPDVLRDLLRGEEPPVKS